VNVTYDRIQTTQNPNQMPNKASTTNKTNMVYSMLTPKTMQHNK